MPPWNAPKTKVQLRIAVQRLRMLQEKKSAQLKSARRDIATLLEIQKMEKARVKVESIINEDIYVELLELLELYCELLIARFGLLEMNTREPDQGVAEAVCAIIHASPRTELKELHILRDMLMHKYGREFAVAVMENKDGCVSERITKKLAYLTPSPQLVDAYLTEIARGYSVNWVPPVRPSEKDEDGPTTDSGADGSGGGDLKETLPKGIFEHPLEIPEAKKPVLPDIPPTEDESQSQSPPPSNKVDGSTVLGVTLNVSAKGSSGGVGKEDEAKDSSTSSAAVTGSTMRLPPSVPSVTPPPYTPSSTSTTQQPSSVLAPPPKSPVDEFTALAQRLEALKKR